MFHFLVVFEPEYEEETVEQHLRIIEGREGYELICQKYVWWGKFARRLDKEGRTLGTYLDEENLFDKYAETAAADANRRIGEGYPVYLFIINPDRGPESLYVARIRRVVFSPDQPMPPDDDPDLREKRPQCAYMSDYYFFKDKDLKKCAACIKRDDNCRTRFLCNFFFKIDKLEHRPSEWANLELAPNNPRYPPRSDNRIRLSVQNYYPALVHMKEFRELWSKVEMSPVRSVFEVLGQAQKVFGDSLMFLDSAIKSAADSPYRQPDRVWLLFEALDQLVQSWRSAGRVEGTWKKALKKRGLDYKPQISQTSRGKFGSEYEFLYNGRHILFEEHVTFGAGQPENCLSVHWIRDEKDKKLIIGWCGRHLTNTLT